MKSQHVLLYRPVEYFQVGVISANHVSPNSRNVRDEIGRYSTTYMEGGPPRGCNESFDFLLF